MSEVDKAVYLVAAFPVPDPAPDHDSDSSGRPVSGLAQDVVAVMATAGAEQRFEWVGSDVEDSVANPALVSPVPVEVGLPSPWHRPEQRMATGLIRLSADQLGTGSIDEDLAHLLTELERSRGGPVDGDDQSLTA